MYFLVGYHGSGKTTVADHLIKKYNYVHIERSAVLNAALADSGDDRHLEMRQWREEMTRRFGRFILEDLIAREATTQAVERRSTDILITGNRNLDEINYTIDRLGHLGVSSEIISILSDPSLLYKRYVERARNPADKSLSKEGFLNMIQRENEAGILEVFNNSDYTIVNDGSISTLLSSADAIFTRATVK